MVKRYWRPFRDQLDKGMGKEFDRMLDASQAERLALTAIMGTKPICIRPVMMEIVFHHYRLLK